MDGEPDAAGEYERLRAELADFVLDVLAQRIASGQQPELSRALVEAIDRRVDEAVNSRMSRAEWPDPDAFADSVIAAAAGRGGGSGAGGSDSYRPRERREGSSGGGSGARSRSDSGSGGMTRVQWILLLVIGLLIVAAAAWYFLLRTPAPAPQVYNVANNSFEVTPDGTTNVPPPPANNAQNLAPPAEPAPQPQ